MNRSNFFHRLVLVVIIISLLVSRISVSYAQDFEDLSEETDPTPFDLIVSPPTSYLKIRPGNNAVHTITITNNGTRNLSVTPNLISFSADGTTGQPVLAETNDFPYLDQDRTSFETLLLPAGKTAQLTLHFTVPSTAENKEYPLTVLFRGEGVNPTSSEEELTPVSGVVGSNIIVLISDTEFLDNLFSIESFGNRHFIDSFTPLEFSPVVKNNSFAAAAATGSATLKNWSGTEVARYEISPSVVLGYSSKKIEPLSTPESITGKDGMRLFVYDSAFLIGPYTFSVFLPSGDPNNPTYNEEKIIVWAVPWVLLGAISATCFCLGGYYFYKKKQSVF